MILTVRLLPMRSIVQSFVHVLFFFTDCDRSIWWSWVLNQAFEFGTMDVVFTFWCGHTYLESGGDHRPYSSASKDHDVSFFPL